MCKRLLGMLGIPAAALLLLAALACGPAADDAAPIDTSGAPVGGPPYSAIVITSDLAVGRDRLAFGVVDSASGMPVRAGTAQVSLYRLPPGDAAPVFRQSLTPNSCPGPPAPGCSWPGRSSTPPAPGSWRRSWPGRRAR